MLLAHGAPSHPGGPTHAQQAREWHCHAYPDVLLPEKPTETAGQTSTESQHQNNAAPQFGHCLAKECSEADAEDQQHLIAPARHDPADLNAAVLVFEQRGDAIGVNFYTGDLKHLFATGEAGVGHVEQIPQRGCRAAD